MEAINLEEEREKRNNLIDRLTLDETVVYKKKGFGNKYFNAFCLKYIVSDIETSKGEIKETEDILIAFRDSNGYEKVNSTLSAVINENWSNNGSGAKYTRGQYIVGFLNWVLRHKQYYTQFKSLADLTIEMARDYAYLLSFETVRETHTHMKNTLNKLYKSLGSHEMLRYVSMNDVGDDIFHGVRLAPRKIRELTHKIPDELIPKLIKVSEAETPEITFGVMLGILSGTRVSELTNLSRSSVTVLGKNDLKLRVKNRPLRPEVSSPRTRGRTKKPRKQRVYNDELGSIYFGVNKLKEVYNNHLEMYKPKDGSGALFVDSNGNAMTTSTFNYRFNLLKEKFLQYLEKSDDPIIYIYANTLRQKKWATHLMRGIFSNAYAEQTEKPQELQIARGDDNEKSSLRYIADTDKMTKQKEEALQDSRQAIFFKKPLPITEFKPNLGVKNEGE